MMATSLKTSMKQQNARNELRWFQDKLWEVPILRPALGWGLNIHTLIKPLSCWQGAHSPGTSKGQGLCLRVTQGLGEPGGGREGTCLALVRKGFLSPEVWVADQTKKGRAGWERGRSQQKEYMQRTKMWDDDDDNNNIIKDTNIAFQCAKLYFILFYLLFWGSAPRSMRDLSSQTRDRTCAPCSGSTEP